MTSAQNLARSILRRLPPRAQTRARQLYRSARRSAATASNARWLQRAVRRARKVATRQAAHPIDRAPTASDPLELTAATVWYEVPASPFQRFLVTVSTSTVHASDERAALLQYRFLDRLGRELENEAVNKPRSPAYGYFDYLPRTPEDGVSSQVVFTPEGTATLEVGIRRYKPEADAAVTVNGLSVENVGGRLAFQRYDLPEGLPPRSALRVAVVADTFTLDALRFQCQVLALSNNSWKSELDEFEPDLVLIESAWSGNDGDWIYEVVHLTEKRTLLRDLLSHTRSLGIPSLFWNKEDPPHFEDFLEAARLCDYVATTDAEMIPNYIERLGHDRVFALPFAVQADLHNPRKPRDEKADRIPTAAFLGSWWAEKFDERRHAQEALLEGASGADLAIYDRYFDFNDHERYRFPKRWLQYIHGSLSYDRVLSAYRRFGILLNVNTVTTSETMFSRRALEAAACGAVVISNPSVGTRAALGELVLEASDADETAQHARRLLDDPLEREKHGHRSYVHVHQHHTWDNRLRDVTEAMGLWYPQPRQADKISVVLATKRPEGARRILEWLEVAQQRDLELEPILLTAFDPAELGDDGLIDRVGATVEQERSDETLGDCLNRGADMATGNLVAKVDDDDVYGPGYFDDLLLGMRVSRADIVGKQSHLQYFEGADTTVLRYPGADHRFTEFVCGSTLLIRREVFDQVRFPSRRVGEDTNFLNRARGAGFRLYSTDPFSYISMRRADLDSHTWRADDEQILGSDLSQKICTGLATDLLEI